MREEILSNLEDPVHLEKLYRSDKSAFKQAFKMLHPQLEGNKAAGFWNARINFTREDAGLGSKEDLIFVIVASLIAGVIAKLPALLGIDEQYFYTRNVGFIIFPALSAYFVWKNKLSLPKTLFLAAATLAGLIFINALPNDRKSDTLMLSCIHLLLLLWTITGIAFVGNKLRSTHSRLQYLSYNGDLVVMTTLIVIAGGILTGITIGLFSLIGFSIEKFYFSYVVIFALPAAPVLGTYLTRTNPQLVGKVSPVIAKIFSPLVLIMLVIYLVAIIYSAKDPYNDRQFLLIFNALLIGVMAIIFFSVAETSRTGKNKIESWILFLLSAVTIIVNGIALSAILFRISSGGMTPNRAAVLGSNLLILINLFLVTAKLFKVVSKKADVAEVGNVIAGYLPIYCLWAALVTIIFPLIFGFR